jgi:putative ABC transport system permease protein
MGVFNLYRSVESYNNTVVPLMKTILYVAISFTFIMLFLYAFLNTQTNKKQIGIYRSLGFTSRDVIKMYVVEYGVISFISLLIGLGIGLMGIDYINNLVFSKTIFLDSGLLQITGDSTLYVLGISFGIVLLTSVLPMIKLLQMTPINIINKD